MSNTEEAETSPILKILYCGPGLPFEAGEYTPLNKLGCRFVFTSNSQEARALAAENSFSLLLTHKQWGRQSGMTLCEHCKKLFGGSRLPMLMLAQNLEFGDVVWALQNGLDAFLPHNCSPALLAASISQALQPEPFDHEATTLLVGHTQVSTPLPPRRACNLLASCLCHDSCGLLPGKRKPGRDSMQQQRPLRLLLAEDNPTNRLYLSRLLTGMGHKLTVAENGKEALKALENNTFDLALLDIQMPVMDGMETLRRIRQGQSAAPVEMPVLAITAHGLDGDREHLLHSGFDDYLSKPVAPQDIAASLEKLCGYAKFQAPLSAESGAPEDSAAGQEELAVSGQGSYTLNRDKTLLRLKDEQFVNSLYKAFLHDLSRREDSMQTALEQRDYASLRKQAHSLKGALAVLDADQAREKALALEMGAKEQDPHCDQFLEELCNALATLSAELQKNL